MVGNQIEEAILRDQQHPSHRHRSPVAVIVAIALVAIAIWVMEQLDLPLLVEALLAAAVLVPLILAALYLDRRVIGERPSDAVVKESDARSEHEQGLPALIARARASGAFDRWEHREADRDAPGHEK